MFLLNYCSKALRGIFSSVFPLLKFFVFMATGSPLCVIFALLPLQTFTGKTFHFKRNFSYFSHGDEQPAMFLYKINF